MVKNTLQDAGLLITRFYQGLNRGWWFCVAAFAVGVTVVVVADAAFLFLASFKVHFVYSCVICIPIQKNCLDFPKFCCNLRF